MSPDPSWNAAQRLEGLAGEARINLTRLVAIVAFYGHHLVNVFVIRDDPSLQGAYHTVVTSLVLAARSGRFARGSVCPSVSEARVRNSCAGRREGVRMNQITTCPHCSTRLRMLEQITEKTLICPHCFANVDNPRPGAQIRAPDLDTDVKRDVSEGTLVLIVFLSLGTIVAVCIFFFFTCFSLIH